MEIYKFNVCADYVPYIINGDATIFDYYDIYADEEHEHLDWWLDKNTRELGVGHYGLADDSSAEFRLCDVTGVYGNCVTITYTVM